MSHTNVTDHGLPLSGDTTSTLTAEDHVFNDDLLMNSDDLGYAQRQFPQIIHVLDNPRLRAAFAHYEQQSNRARDRVRALGLATVLFALLALLALVTRPIWPHTNFERWVALILELGGLLAAVVASGGVWLGPWRRRWLEGRLMTERLRQWHFQIFVRRGRQIEDSLATPNGIHAFEAERSRWLDSFLKSHQGHLDSEVEALISDPAYTGTWLHEPHATYRSKSPALAYVFEAYLRLRFDHQYSYAVYKLRDSDDRPLWDFLKWPAVRQARFLSNMGAVGFAAAIICAAILIVGHAWGFPANIESYVRTTALGTALIGLALRTLEDGFAPEQEIERYNDYRGRVAQLRDRFKQTTDQKERLHLMEEMEAAAVDELRGFLRTHKSSRFVLA